MRRKKAESKSKRKEVSSKFYSNIQHQKYFISLGYLCSVFLTNDSKSNIVGLDGLSEVTEISAQIATLYT